MTTTKSNPTPDHLLIYWPHEATVSTVKRDQLVKPSSPRVNDTCLVRVGNASVPGVVAEMGSPSRLVEMKAKFAAGDREGMSLLGVQPLSPEKANTPPRKKGRPLSQSENKENHCPDESGPRNNKSKRLLQFNNPSKRSLYDPKPGYTTPHNLSVSDVEEIIDVSPEVSTTTEPVVNPLQDSTNTATAGFSQDMGAVYVEGGSQVATNMQLCSTMKMMENDMTLLKNENAFLTQRVRSLEMMLASFFPFVTVTSPGQMQPMAALPTSSSGNLQSTASTSPQAAAQPSNTANAPSSQLSTLANLQQAVCTTLPGMKQPVPMSLQPTASANLPTPMLPTMPAQLQQTAGVLPSFAAMLPPAPMAPLNALSAFPMALPTDQIPGPSHMAAMPQPMPCVIQRPVVHTIPPPQPILPNLKEYSENIPELLPCGEVLQKYQTLITPDFTRMGVLAVKLARESYFGDDVLSKCTPTGWNNRPALPSARLNAIKFDLFKAFIQHFGTDTELFERKWSTAQEAISQCCKRLRKKGVDSSK